MVPILINKDVLEPSYNDSKFTAWNHNYVHTNLIYAHITQFQRLSFPQSWLVVCQGIEL